MSRDFLLSSLEEHERLFDRLAAQTAQK